MQDRAHGISEKKIRRVVGGTDVGYARMRKFGDKMEAKAKSSGSLRMSDKYQAAKDASGKRASAAYNFNTAAPYYSMEHHLPVKMSKVGSHRSHYSPKYGR
jgi:hypothetical protein